MRLDLESHYEGNKVENLGSYDRDTSELDPVGHGGEAEHYDES